MEKEIVVALLGIIPVILTNIITYQVALFKTREPPKKGILKEQFEKVYSPIHQLVSYEQFNDNQIRIKEIDTTIKENFPLVPTQIIESFKKAKQDENFNEAYHDFTSLVANYYEIARLRLGYSQIDAQISNKKEENERTDISPRASFFIGVTYIAILGTLPLAVFFLDNILHIIPIFAAFFYFTYLVITLFIIKKK